MPTCPPHCFAGWISAGVRATGLLLARALANRVRMEDCVCRYLNLSASDWKSAIFFQDCDLSGASIRKPA